MRFSKKKFLTATVVAFLSGMTAVSAASYETAQKITGTATYADGDTIEVYDATNAAGFSVTGENGVVNIGTDGKGTINISAESSSSDNSYANGIFISPGSNLTLNGNVNISSVYGGSCFANGISVLNAGSGTGAASTVIINGNIQIGDPSKQNDLTDDSTNKEWGVNAAEMHGGYGADGHAAGADKYSGARWSPTGISINATGHGSSITLNGSLYIAMRGTALATDPYNPTSGKTAYELAVINANKGDVTIYTPESTTESYYAAASYGGTININMNDDRTAGAGHNVKIQGNLLSMKEYESSGQPYFYQDGRINLALDTASSYWTGVIDNSGKNQAGEVNLWLQNGATWTHKSPSKTNGLQAKNMPTPSIDHYGQYDKVSHVANFHGGASEDKAGNIFTEGTQAIQITDYDGYTNVYYSHSGNGESSSDYEGGDITIGNAAEGSGISLITDNTGITMTNTDNVAKVLNALAGKLTYSAYATGEKNLSGTVKIADGLTASSAALKTGNISFTDTGKGSYVKGDDPKPVPTEFSETLTGVLANDTVYVDAGILVDNGEHYVFTRDTTLNNAVDSTTAAGSAAINIAKDVGHAVDIKAEGHTLTINTTSTGNKDAQYGIAANSFEGTTITADKLVIKGTSDKGRIEGFNVGGQGQQNKDNPNKLTVNGDIDMNIQGIGYTLGLYAAGNSEVTFNGDVTAMGDETHTWGLDATTGVWGYYGCSLIYSGSNYTLQMGPKVTINGDVNIKVNGNGLFGNGGHAKLTVNGGGYIEVNKDNTHNYYALLAECATTSLNVNLDDNYIATSARNNKLVLKGNVTASTGAVNINEPELYTYVNLGLATSDSEWTGVAYNKFGDAGKAMSGKVDGVQTTKTFKGSINVFLQNGATWNNEAWGAVETGAYGAVVAFSGSHLAKLVGGTTEANAGNIFQKDSNPLTIDNYSGYTNIYYAHTNDGDEESDYTAGNTVIKSAVAGSAISLITDNTGIDMTNDTSVSNALNALAGKLYYTGYKTGTNERNLTGKVKIADGLTASSAVKMLGDIIFDETSGKGSLDADSRAASDQTVDSYTQSITGVATTDKYYKKTGVLKDAGEHYVFTKDTTISISNSATPVAYPINIARTVDHAVDINAEGHTLTINTDNTTKKSVYGIAANTTAGTTITADTLTVNAIGKDNTTNKYVTLCGIDVGENGKQSTDTPDKLNIIGNVNLNVQGYSYTYGIFAKGNSDVTINGNLTSVGTGEYTWGLQSVQGLTKDKTGNYNYSYCDLINGTDGQIIVSNTKVNLSPKVTVNGDLNAKIDGNGLHGIGGYFGNGQITVNGGGYLEVNKENTRGFYAMIAESATTNLNVNLDENGLATSAQDHKLVLKGNVAASSYKTSFDTSGTHTYVNLGLATKDSEWTGVAYNMFPETGKTQSGSGGVMKTFYGSINVFLQNGATWNNEAWGEVRDTADSKGVAFSGSHLDKLVGGTSEANAGNIFQKDTNPLTIDNYSGYTNIYYAHSNDGDEETDYTAGNTVIKSAAEGSTISLITDNTGIDMTDDTVVDNALNALAGKLYYTGYITGTNERNLTGTTDERNLTGTVKIADGLTASSAVKMLGRIVYDETTGKGSLDRNTVQTPEQSVDAYTRVITGDAEADKYYTRTGVRQSDGTYQFTTNPSSVTTTETTVNAANNDVTIQAPDAALTLENTTEGGTAISAGTGHKVSVDSKDLTVKGNVSSDGGNIEIKSIDGEESGKVTIDGDLSAKNNGTVDVKLVGEDSSLTGGYTADADDKVSVNVFDGATWTLTDLDGTASAGNGGAKISGGTSESAAGNLYMQRSDNMKISDYSGWLNIYYDHDNDGKNAIDYTAGNVEIGNIASGSGLILSTNDTLETAEKDSKTAVEEVFTALAPKLKLSDADNQKDNLSDKIMRLYSEEGLTASTVEASGEFEIDENGYAQYVKDSVDMDGISAGDYETFVMKGVRSAAMTSFHAWRDNMSDTYTAADLADLEDGIFAKVLGGKTKSDIKGAREDNTYKGVQVGYDKALKNGWHMGVAFDYRDGDSDYLLGGTGDDTLYSFGVYGTKQLKDNRYFRVAAKVGHVENEYEVYNETRNIRLDGKLGSTAYGITAEYGQVFQKNDAYIMPKVQFTWAHVGGKDYTATASSNASLDIFQDAYQSFVGRIGVEAGLKKAKGGFYGALYFAHEFGGDVNSRYYAKDGGWKSTAFDGNDSWVEFALGGRYNANDRTQLYMDFARDFGGNFEHQWKANLGVRFSF